MPLKGGLIASVQVTDDGAPLSRLRPKLIVFSYYNPLGGSAYVFPGDNSDIRRLILPEEGKG